MSVTFQTKYMRYSIASDGKNMEFTDISSGRNYVADGYCGKLIDLEKKEHLPTAVAYCAPHLEVTYGNGITAVIAVAEHEEYLTFRLVSVTSEQLYSVSVVDVEVDIDYDNDSSFIASCMSMTLGTRMEEYPGRNRRLYAEAFPHIGLTSTRRSDHPANAAIVGAPEPLLRQIMKNVIEDIPDGELPKSKTGGPYGCEIELGKCTYTILGSPVTTDNIDEVIAAMKKFGVKQASLHQGAMYRQGDFQVNEKAYPGGIEQFKAVIDRFHREGLIVGLHTYTFFLAKAESLSVYTTPVPHPDLDTLQEFTLALDLDESSTEVIVNESLHDVSLTTGFHSQNTLILWIDDELIRFTGVSDAAPYTFTGCERGAYGTKAALHRAGVRAGHLKSYFGGYLAPKKHSELFYEIARNTAEFYNECEFDAFYLDAIDGVFILDGNEFAWYHAMAFINEMYKHLKRPAVFDCCYGPQYPASWFARTRFGALDHPYRAYNDFNDVHVEYDAKTAERMYLVPQLGWWSLYPSGKEDMIGWQQQVMTIEELEYLCIKHLAMDACQCYQGSMMRYKELPVLERFAAVIRQYDEVRESGYFRFDKQTEQLLRAPRSEFKLVKEEEAYHLRRMKTTKYRAESFEEGRNTFLAANPYSTQKPFIRIEALWTAEPYESPDSRLLLDLDEEAPLELNRTYSFAEPLDTEGRRGIGVWICGDGRGETINIRLRSELWVGAAMADHFIKVDFTGWRRFSFYESQNGDMEHGDWPRAELEYRIYDDVKNFYASYTNSVDYARIHYMDLLTSGKGRYDLKMKPIVALPHREQTLVNPTVTINGQSVTFMTELRSGTYLECSAEGECTVYDRKGSVIDTPAIAGEIPVVLSGNNELTITSSEASPYMKRAAVTLRLMGEYLI
ncbi:hypothetical protein FE783_05135 [Paenibacillus mesophilus]|uniref:hypothetical protein n=1 Tax=Paenibacillus mesophilus TaxID=2582849 RepID=UPI00110E3990|nr:hypothetical protein [Paenibacillus mesophilus]TMV52326.1 hypothetical protein FE783_05135 [Paenibacillus mesophilus]